MDLAVPRFPLTFSTEQSGGHMQAIGSIEGRARARRFLTRAREKGSRDASDRTTVRGDSRSDESKRCPVTYVPTHCTRTLTGRLVTRQSTTPELSPATRCDCGGWRRWCLWLRPTHRSC